MYLTDKRVFVAGATGLVGNSILKCILEHDQQVKIRAVRNQTVPYLFDDRIEYVEANLESPEECRLAVADCNLAVMAAAITSGAGILTTQPWQQINPNLVMNAVLLQALSEAEVKRVVMIGSATLYQPFEGFIAEDQLDLNLDPPDAYLGIGWVTRYIEKLCKFWHKQSGMSIAIVRASNIFGPFSRFNPQTSNFIPALIRKAVDHMDPFEVWGSSNVTRDVIYVDDFARAVVMMLEREYLPFEVFNVGSGIRTTVGDVVTWSLKYAGYEPSRIVYNEQGPTTVPFRALDCTKAQNVLNWAPQVTVEQGIRKTVEWWKQNKDRWIK